LSFLTALLVVSFGLNWLWEMAQMPAYVETARRSWRETALQCAAFSVGDAVLTWAIYAVAVTAVRRIRSLTGLKFYLLISALGVMAALFIELMANAMVYWTYSERMPTVLGVGLLPILQLATLVPVSVWIALRWKE
jgi:hypothetical protein